MKHNYLLCKSVLLFGSLILAGSISANWETSRSLDKFKDDTTTLEGGRIGPGAGYSTDRQQIAPAICYNSPIIDIVDAQGDLVFKKSVTYRELLERLEIRAMAEGNIGMFSANADYKYLRSIKDKDYSLSINYLHRLNNKVNLKWEGYGESILTDDGKLYYQDGNNKLFGLACGDKILSSYHQGALLMFSLNIQFASHEEKKRYEGYAGISYGDIFSASASIEEIAKEHSIKGRVDIQARQKGGDPSKLAKIFDKDPNGEYYALTCSITDMKNCKKLASGLLDYAVNVFPEQFNNNMGHTPIGVDFTERTTIDQVGLNVPDSLVTRDVIQDRIKLSRELKKYDYYSNRLHELVKNYAVDWDKHSKLYRTSERLLEQRANNNYDLIMNRDTGAKGCFTDPHRCRTFVEAIESRIRPINDNDLDYLDAIKYYMHFANEKDRIYGDNFYYYSDHPYLMRSALRNRDKLHYFELNHDKTAARFELWLWTRHGAHYPPILHKRTIPGKFPKYYGVVDNWTYDITMKISDYYFEPYQTK